MRNTQMSVVRAALAAFSLVVVAACGADGDGAENKAAKDSAESSQSDQGTAGHNEADVSFVSEMIPHHEQAVEMSKLAVPNQAGPEVRDLAARIEKAQAPEIEQLSGWLEAWGESAGEHSHHDMVDGMMTPEDLTKLRAAKGADFDRLYMTQMIEHHEGAVEMAQRELREGEAADAVTMAKAIIKGQTAEIAEMEKLLG